MLEAGDEEANIPSDNPISDSLILEGDKEQEDNRDASNISIIAEAQLVNDTEAVDINAEERERIEEETKKKIYNGAAEAQVVLDDAGSKAKRRRLMCIGLIILTVLIVGVTVGLVTNRRSSVATSVASSDTEKDVADMELTTTSMPSQFLSRYPSMSPSTVPTEAPLDNNFCDQAHEVVIGSIIETSLENATKQFGKACNHGWLPYDPGLFYRFRGTGAPVTATVSNLVSVNVYTSCSLSTCLPGVIFKNTSHISWETNTGTEYIIKVSDSRRGWFTLTIANNDVRENALGPIEFGTATSMICEVPLTKEPPSTVKSIVAVVLPQQVLHLVCGIRFVAMEEPSRHLPVMEPDSIRNYPSSGSTEVQLAESYNASMEAKVVVRTEEAWSYGNPLSMKCTISLCTGLAQLLVVSCYS